MRSNRLRSENDVEQAVKQNADVVWRVCSLYFSSTADIQDAFQETFIRYLQAYDIDFEDDEHKKAWLIRVARTRCLDILKAADRKRTIVDDSAFSENGKQVGADPMAASLYGSNPYEQPGSFASEVLDIMRMISDPPRTPLYLAICEEYTASEIAEMLNAPIGTVYSWISRGKKLLRKALS